MPKQKSKSNDVVQGEVMDEENLAVTLREAPEERRIDIEKVLQAQISQAQLSILTGETPKWAIKVRPGPGGTGLKYVPHGYVTDVLNKAFGFDWDLVIDDIEQGKKYALMSEDGKRYVAVCGHIIVRVRKQGKVVAEIRKDGFGSQVWNDKMEFGDALKGARSDLVKTCGFQYGIALDLYYNERAEIDGYVKKEVKKREDQKIADQLLKSDPAEPIQLLTRSTTEYGYDAMKVAEICNSSLEEIMTFNSDAIARCWKEVKEYAEENK